MAALQMSANLNFVQNKHQIKLKQMFWNWEKKVLKLKEMFKTTFQIQDFF